MIKLKNYVDAKRIQKSIGMLSLSILFLPMFFISESQADEKCFSSNLTRIAAENITLQKILDTEPEYLITNTLDSNGSEIKTTNPNVKRKVAEVALQMNNLQLLLCKSEAKDIEIAEDKTTSYTRSAFKHWIDADKNGCNTRAEVLIEEAVVKPKIGPKCKLTGGKWISAFDGKTITKASQLDVDHMVPLAEAWRSGAWKWTSVQRQAFANDLDNPEALIAVTLSTNRSKGDRDPALWMPLKDQCVYVQNWVSIKSKYSLTADINEAAKLNSLYDTCGLAGAKTVLPVPVSSPTPQAIPTPEISPTPTKDSSPPSNTQLVTPGAFCSPAGAIGKSSSGVTYTCKTSLTDSRNRWRQ
jgi:hypothetical protein